VLLLLHALALAGFVAWLRQSDRLSKPRVAAMVDIFRLTHAQERQQAEDAQRALEEANQKALELARLKAVGEGPVTLVERLTADQQSDELGMQRVERLRQDIRALRDQVERAKQELARQRAELDAERQAFESAKARELAVRNSQSFQQAVEMLEKLKPKQAKQMFQVMLNEKRDGEVVDYLAAMQMRSAAAVIKEFKQGGEIDQATQLLDQLRKRGVDLAPASPDSPSAATPSPTGPAT
jgi:hypothetical protein